MKYFFTACCLALLVLAVSPASLVAQATGDFRTNGTGGGNWSAAGTWQTFNGSSWVAASAAPTGSEMITVQHQDSVTVDVNVTVSGTLAAVDTGRVVGSLSTLRFSSTGVYWQARDGGTVPPATYDSGSTVRVTGGVSVGGPQFPSNTPVYNIEINNRHQTGSLQMGMTDTMLTINGNLRMGATVDTATGTVAQYRFAGSSLVSGTRTRTINILGSLILDSARSLVVPLASTTAGTGITLHVKNVVLNAGEFSVNRASSNSSTTLYCSGDFTIAAGARMTRNSSSTQPVTIIFNGTGVQNFTNAGSISSGMQTPYTMNVDSGSIFNTGLSEVNGGVNFTLKTGATLRTARDGGVDSAIAVSNGSGTAVTVTFQRGSSFEFDGSVAQVTGISMPKSIDKLTINNANGVTLSDTCLANRGLDLVNGPLVTGAFPLTVDGIVTRTAGYVNGPLTIMIPSPSPMLFAVGTANGASPVSVDVLSGSGSMTVKATQGAHPNVFNASTTLLRYWTMNADAGITLANLTFGYPASDVQGREATYGAWRYTGTGTSWDSLKSVPDSALHTVTTDSVTALSADWTLGVSSLTPLLGIGPNGLDVIPQSFFVDQNYPNPFNPSTVISYGLPKSADVSVKVYTMLGQLVSTLVEGRQPAGTYTLRFNAAGLASGVYFYRVQAGTNVAVKRMMLVK